MVIDTKLSDYKTAEQIEAEYVRMFLPSAEMQDVSTPRNATPASNVEYRAPMRDEWFDRMEALLTNGMG